MDILCGYISLGLCFSVYRAVCPGNHKIFHETSNSITQIFALGKDYYSRILLFFKVLLANTTGEAVYPVLILLSQIHQCFAVNLSMFKPLNTTNLLQKTDEATSSITKTALTKQAMVDLAKKQEK